MKRLFSFFLIFTVLINFSGCASSDSLHSPLPVSQENPSPLRETPRKNNALQNDQMILVNFNSPFQLKIGQAARFDLESGHNFIFTPKKISEDSRCYGLISEDGAPIPNCTWSGQVMVFAEILKDGDSIDSLNISSIKPTISQDLVIHLTEVEPAKRIKYGARGGIEVVPIADEDYIFTFEIKKAS